MARKKLRHVRVEGTPYEMGFQHGKKSGPLIDGLFEALISEIRKHEGIHDVDRLLARTAEYIPYVEAELPHLATEIKGIAEGANIKEEKVHFIHLQGEIRMRPILGCTSFAAFFGEDKPRVLIGQNFDMPPSFMDFGQLLEVHPIGGVSLIAYGLVGTVAQRGVNSSGLALVGNGLGSPDWRLGISSILSDRYALEQESVVEAVMAIKRLTRAKSTNALIADGEGNIVNLETTPDQVRELTPSRNVMAHGNHYDHPEFLDIKQSLLGIEVDSLARTERLHELLEKCTTFPSLDEIRGILADHHGYPQSVCRHDGDSKWGHVTMASLVADPGRRVLFALAGNPCQDEYLKFKLIE